VKELLQRHQKNIALHGPHAARWDHTLSLAERTEERLAGADLRLGQARLEALETEAVETRQELRRVELIVADRAAKQVVHRRRRFADRGPCLTLAMVCRRSHLV